MKPREQLILGLFCLTFIFYCLGVLDNYGQWQEAPAELAEPPAPAPPRLKQVISFSIFAKKTAPFLREMHFAGLVHNAYLQPQVYPGWQLRLYVASDLDPDYDRVFQDMGYEVIRKPFKLGRWMEGMFWRFEVADDPTVARFLVRDVDSRLTLRERWCVDEWIKDGTALHSIRDHPYHTVPMLGGMWGGVGQLMRYASGANTTMKELIGKFRGSFARHGEDQDFLGASVWPRFEANLSEHESVRHGFCTEASRPHCHSFPTNDFAAHQEPACFDRETIGNVHCYYFVGAAYGPDTRPCCNTFDCTASLTCTRVWRSYLDEFEELAGYPLPAKFIAPDEL